MAAKVSVQVDKRVHRVHIELFRVLTILKSNLNFVINHCISMYKPIRHLRLSVIANVVNGGNLLTDIPKAFHFSCFIISRIHFLICPAIPKSRMIVLQHYSFVPIK